MGLAGTRCHARSLDDQFIRRADLGHNSGDVLLCGANNSASGKRLEDLTVNRLEYFPIPASATTCWTEGRTGRG